MTSAVEKAVETVKLTIDGVEVTAPKGALLIRVAEEMGIAIPRFCDHPLLAPAGACRQCLVEVEGQRKPVASCTQTVADGMVVKTQLTSPVAEKAQAGVMELLLMNHPLDCPMCDKGGECPLQNQAMSTGRTDSRFKEEKRTYQKPINISSQVLLDRERCVLCQRCTRFSEEIAGDTFIDLMERSSAEQIGVYRDAAFEHPTGHDTDRRDAPTPQGRAGARRRRVQLVLLRQHRADLPGRRAHRCAVPVPRPPVRPGLHAERVRALRGRLRPAHRPPARQGAAAPGRQRPGGQRRVELRQGPVGLPVRHRVRSDHAPDGPRHQDRRAARGELARGSGGGGRGPAGRQAPTVASAC